MADSGARRESTPLPNCGGSQCKRRRDIIRSRSLAVSLALLARLDGLERGPSRRAIFLRLSNLNLQVVPTLLLDMSADRSIRNGLQLTPKPLNALSSIPRAFRCRRPGPQRHRTSPDRGAL